MRRLLLAVILLAAGLPIGPPASAQDPSAEMERLIDAAQAQPSIYGPRSGEILMETGTVNIDVANVQVRDLFAHATFTNPYPAAEHLFDFGISFRLDTGDEAFSLIVDSEGAWFLRLTTSIVDNGQGVALATGVNETNHLDLVAVGDTGYFSVNDVFVDTIDLSQRDVSGEVAVGTGYFAEDKVDGATSPYVDFEVWSLDFAGGTTSGSAGEQSDAEQFAALMEEAEAQPSIAGPLSGDVPMNESGVDLIGADVDVRDFFAHATFTNPYPATDHLWDIGFSFRRTAIDEEFKLIIDSNGAWFFKEGLDPAIATGQVSGLALGEDETNHLDLVAVGDTGYFSVNGQFVSTLDLSTRDVSGEVAVGTGFYTEDKVVGESTPFTEFEVWALGPAPDVVESGQEASLLAASITEARSRPSIAGPFAGEVALETGAINSVYAGVDVADFYAHAVFTNPYGASEFPFDIGIGFRAAGRDEDLRIAVDSGGEWFLSSGPSPILASGTGAVLDTNPGGRNTLDFVAIGDTGHLGMNGEDVATVDLSERTGSGDVWISSGFFREHKIDGRSAQYADFEVWSLDPAPPPAPPPAGPEDGDGEASGGEGGQDGQDSGVLASGPDEVIFDLLREDGPGLFGIVAMTADGEQTRVQVAAFEATGSEEIGIHAGTCVDFTATPLFRLNSVRPDSLTAESVLDVSLDALTDGGYVLVVRGANGGSVVACSVIPAS